MAGSDFAAPSVVVGGAAAAGVRASDFRRSNTGHHDFDPVLHRLRRIRVDQQGFEIFPCLVVFLRSVSGDTEQFPGALEVRCIVACKRCQTILDLGIVRIRQSERCGLQLCKAFQQLICTRLLCEGIVSCNRIRDLAGLDLLTGETQLGYSPISCGSGLSDFGESLLGFVFLFLVAEVFGRRKFRSGGLLGRDAPAFEELVTTDRENEARTAPATIRPL